MAGRIAAFSAQNVSGSTAGDSVLTQRSGVMPDSSEPQPTLAAGQERADMEVVAQETPEAGPEESVHASHSQGQLAEAAQADLNI